ncbi:hypothetical protein CRENBAI_026677 [Crenichthys baileyi]|uniref:Uncharacterized protein n=1 Tax=Crenichthys baileyi TaxID=28760 RepID=A0AAV9R164_9TELE
MIIRRIFDNVDCPFNMNSFLILCTSFSQCMLELAANKCAILSLDHQAACTHTHTHTSRSFTCSRSNPSRICSSELLKDNISAGSDHASEECRPPIRSFDS